MLEGVHLATLRARLAADIVSSQEAGRHSGMSAKVVYEIARYKFHNADPVLMDRLQLIAQDGALRLRDADGNEIPCKETDIASAIGSTPALRRVPKNGEARITCGEDILGQLPALLEPIPDGASLLVNGQAWDAFPTFDGDDVMLPGFCGDECAPEMNPCWAEYSCAEGGRSTENQLVGFSSIGLLTPGIAIEHGRISYGANGGAAAVETTSFDDFAGTFIDWLLSAPILGGFWQGYRWDITAPGVDLFAEAAIAKDHHGYWEHDETADEQNAYDEGEDGDYENNSWDDEGSFVFRRLELHLPKELIDEVGARLRDMNPEYAAALDRPETSPNQFASETLMSLPPIGKGFVGEVGERVRHLSIINVTVCPLSSSTVLVEGRDPSGRLVKWVTRSQIDAATESITFSVATVKAHESYTGTDKTVLTAAKVAAVIAREI